MEGKLNLLLVLTIVALFGLVVISFNTNRPTQAAAPPLKEPFPVKDCNFVRPANENGRQYVQCGITQQEGWRNVLELVK